VSVPLSVRANERIHGFSFSIDFDETVLQVEDIDIVFRRADGAPWYYELTEFNNADVNPGSSGLDEGYVTGMVIFEFWNESGGIPVDTDTAVAEIRFAVRPDAAIGSTELRFLDGAPSEIGNIENEVVTCGHSVSAPEARSFVFINGVLQIIDEITIFIRGDTNGDAQVNISDPIATLGYLFLGGRRPPCPDAADANDDGTIGLTDAVATLNFLFWGVSPLPPPSAAPGIDLTEDVLGCGQPGE
jgi:hypothetical protein